MNKEQYTKYINSNKWKKKRKVILKAFWNHCCRCGSNKRIHIHHATYENITKEKSEQLVALCSKCHDEFHIRFGTERDMIGETKIFIKELNPEFVFIKGLLLEQKPIIKKKQKKGKKTKERVCRYCGKGLVIQRKRKVPKRGKNKKRPKYFYGKLWVCEERCTPKVLYNFPEDRVYDW